MMSEVFWPTTWWGWALTGAAIFMLCVPAKYDPAVWLKNRTEDWAKRQIDKRRGS